MVTESNPKPDTDSSGALPPQESPLAAVSVLLQLHCGVWFAQRLTRWSWSRELWLSSPLPGIYDNAKPSFSKVSHEETLSSI